MHNSVTVLKDDELHAFKWLTLGEFYLSEKGKEQGVRGEGCGRKPCGEALHRGRFQGVGGGSRLTLPFPAPGTALCPGVPAEELHPPPAGWPPQARKFCLFNASAQPWALFSDDIFKDSDPISGA